MNSSGATAKTTRCLGLRHASLREARDDRQCVHFSRAQGEEIAGHGPGLNPGPDIYAWGEPDTSILRLQAHRAVLDVMSRGPPRGQGVCFAYPRGTLVGEGLSRLIGCWGGDRV